MPEPSRHHSVTEVNSDCQEEVAMAKKETVVSFNLYVVLGFLVLIFSVVIGFLFNANAARDDMDRQTRERLIVLEGKFETINAGITDIKTAMREVTVALQNHERSSRK